jgi:hypothetical protein
VNKFLLPYTKSFKPTIPVFRLNLDGSKRNISLASLQSSNLQNPIEGDCLSVLVCSKFRESFSIKDIKFIIDITGTIESCENQIKNNIATFVKNNMGKKSPTQTRLFRWISRKMPRGNASLNHGLILIYKYISLIKSDKETTIHANNIICMLEAMMKKYGDRK